MPQVHFSVVVPQNVTTSPICSTMANGKESQQQSSSYFPASELQQCWLKSCNSWVQSNLLSWYTPLAFSILSPSDDNYPVENTCSMHQRRAPVVGYRVDGIGESSRMVRTQQGTHPSWHNFAVDVGRNRGPQSHPWGRNLASRYQTREHPPPLWWRKPDSCQSGWYFLPPHFSVCVCVVHLFLQFLDVGCSRTMSESTYSPGAGTPAQGRASTQFSVIPQRIDSESDRNKLTKIFNIFCDILTRRLFELPLRSFLRHPRMIDRGGRYYSVSSSSGCQFCLRSCLLYCSRNDQS